MYLCVCVYMLIHVFRVRFLCLIFPFHFSSDRCLGGCCSALTLLFDVLKAHGTQFRTQWWRDLFAIIFRIYDGHKQPDQVAEVSERESV